MGFLSSMDLSDGRLKLLVLKNVPHDFDLTKDKIIYDKLLTGKSNYIAVTDSSCVKIFDMANNYLIKTILNSNSIIYYKKLSKNIYEEKMIRSVFF